MLELFITMIERLGIIVTIAFVLTRFKFFREMIYQEELNHQQRILAIFFFGFFGIIGTYTGLSLNTESLHFNSWASELTQNEALANSRVIGVALGGLLGGYTVGISAGLIAGIHRFTLGGFTAFSCGFATILAGVLAGMFYKKNKPVKLKTAFFIGVMAEGLQMLIILLFSRPFEHALALVQLIGIPMILANGLGCALFLMVIKSMINEEEKTGAMQAQQTLRIANQTLAYLRGGLNYTSAKEVCQIIHRELGTSAVAMTNLTEILAHVGLGSDHHQPKSPIQTQITMEAIRRGEIVVGNQQLIHCRIDTCPLGAVVIAPLKQRGKIIGTLKFYYRFEKEITNVVMELISGLSSMMSNQLEIAEADKAYQLAKEAEIKALQAQISPHFLFNTLNTIVSLIRIDPTKARRTLVSLSHYLRQNLSVTTQSVSTLEQEINHVKAYLAIEEARFVNKLEVLYDIDKQVLSQSIPPLTLQPLVENSIKHGFKNKENDCVIQISIRRNSDQITIIIKDNGYGMTEERLDEIGKPTMQSAEGIGLALYNVNRRLIIMFGSQSALQIESVQNKGTTIAFSIPFVEGVDKNGSNHKNFNSRR